MATAYTPDLVANAFLYKAKQERALLTHMKLQKLVFFVHAWSLALRGSSYLSEKPEAWTYGPVFDSLYHELKSFGSRAVDSYLLQMNPATGQREGLIPNLSDTDFWTILDQVWTRYGRFSATELSAMTHQPNGPWDVARKTKAGWLADDQVRSYYQAQISSGR